MRFLLLLIGVLFFFIFFLLSQIPGVEGFFIKNIFYEANIYVIVSVLFFLFTLKTSSHNTDKEVNFINSTFSPVFSRQSVYEFIKYFFSDIVYYISIALFYGAFFLIFGEIFPNISFPQIFLFFNILVSILFLLESKVSLFGDFLRVNTSIISLYYIFFHIFYLFGRSAHFGIYDFVNVACIFFLIYLFLYKSSLISHKKIFYSYALGFFFLETLVFLSLLFGRSMEMYLVVSCLFGIIFSYSTDIFQKKLSLPISITRIFTLIFFLFSIAGGIYFSFQEGVFLFLNFIILLVSSIFLFSFHSFFQNYIAALGAYFGNLGMIFTLCSLIFSGEKTYIFTGILYMVFSFFLLFIDKLEQIRHDFDRYFFHVLSLFVNLLGVILFLFFAKTSILLIAFILLVESIYFSLLYYHFKK